MRAYADLGLKAKIPLLAGSVSGYSAEMYIAGQCVEAALHTLGGKGDDRKALPEALHQISVADTPARANPVGPGCDGGATDPRTIPETG